MATIISNRLRQALGDNAAQGTSELSADSSDGPTKRTEQAVIDEGLRRGRGGSSGEKQTTSSPTSGDPLGEPEVVGLMPDIFASDASPDDVPDEPAARRGRPRILDSKLKGVISGMLVLGISRRTAAKYVGCHHSTIANEAKRDPEFARDMRQAEIQSRTIPLTRIYAAAESNWRTAAWLVQREERRRAQKPAMKQAS